MDNAETSIEELIENLKTSRLTLEEFQKEIETLKSGLEALKPESIEYFAIGVSDGGIGKVISLRVTFVGGKTRYLWTFHT